MPTAWGLISNDGVLKSFHLGRKRRDALHWSDPDFDPTFEWFANALHLYEQRGKHTPYFEMKFGEFHERHRRAETGPLKVVKTHSKNFLLSKLIVNFLFEQMEH